MAIATLKDHILHTMQFENIHNAKSQKIRGYKVTLESKLRDVYIGAESPCFVILEDCEAEMFAKHIDLLLQKRANLVAEFLPGRWFGRPCPTVPRHGFVDSRQIMDGNDVLTLWAETRKADPEGELLITPMIDASSNAVVTQFMISLGAGHDGATNGNNAFMLPTQGSLLSEKQRERSGITGSEYIELVYSKEFNKPHITQFRDGPEMPRSKDYIPRDIVIKRVITVNGEDLLAWEKLINELDDKMNTVVWHDGGALGSHYAVHCRLAEVTYITTFEPTVGQRINRISDSVRINYPLVQRGLSYALGEAMDKRWAKKLEHISISAMVGILYSLHHFNLLGNEESFLLGFSIGQMVRLGTAACLGELRHFSGINGSREKKSRNAVYRKYLVDVTGGIEKLKLSN